MSREGPRYGQLISALGAAVLGVSVFLPWYGLTITQGGVQSAQQGVSALAQQYGNSAFQAEANSVTAQFGALAGHQLGTVSAHDALKDLNVVLLILAGIGLLAALLDLAGAAQTGTGRIALVGLLASLCVLYRMLNPPAVDAAALTLSLQWGIWLALAGSVGMIVGDLWPRLGGRAEPSTATLSQALDGLSGWTPQG